MKDKICGITFQDTVSDWKEAIQLVGKSLIESDCIDDSYIEAMIQNVIENGPYIVIVPGFAMPHARPEFGVFKNGMSILKLKQPVLFPDSQEVSLLISFAASDANEHMNLMVKLSDILMDDILMEQLFRANTKEALLEVLQ